MLKLQCLAFVAAVIGFVVHYALNGVQIQKETQMRKKTEKFTIAEFVWSAFSYTVYALSEFFLLLVLNQVPGVNPTAKGRRRVTIMVLAGYIFGVASIAFDFAYRWQGILLEDAVGNTVWTLRSVVIWVPTIMFISCYWSPPHHVCAGFFFLALYTLLCFVTSLVLVPLGLGYLEAGMSFLVVRVAIFVFAEGGLLLMRMLCLRLTHVGAEYRHILYVPAVLGISIMTRLLQGTVREVWVGVLAEVLSVMLEIRFHVYCYSVDCHHIRRFNKWCYAPVRRLLKRCCKIDVGPLEMVALIEGSTAFYHTVPIAHIMAEAFAVCIAPMVLLFYGISDEFGNFSAKLILTQAAIQVMGELVSDVFWAMFPETAADRLKLGYWASLAWSGVSRLMPRRSGERTVPSCDAVVVVRGSDQGRPESSQSTPKLPEERSGIFVSDVVSAWNSQCPHYFRYWLSIAAIVLIYLVWGFASSLSACVDRIDEDSGFIVRRRCGEHMKKAHDWSQEFRRVNQTSLTPPC
ncbi:unnamed protein product [Vitrella brassicaformis CCMP3155]|uniref:Uncharacterized protein n=1 Tax=Vitrella brassicaformis (strain CCMP3155) TaxID=1169540 RepID=A0A0G4H2Z5_VITBC|nr:unnamed protein product [Vitrella brassicaformis CCMP3155]|eukprot:CEM38052.1 unnamed protein product [Vitrella brassicaformis CCMP3155]